MEAKKYLIKAKNTTVEVVKGIFDNKTNLKTLALHDISLMISHNLHNYYAYINYIIPIDSSILEA